MKHFAQMKIHLEVPLCTNIIRIESNIVLIWIRKIKINLLFIYFIFF